MAHAVTEGHEWISSPDMAKGRIDVYVITEAHVDALGWTTSKSHVNIRVCRRAGPALMGDLASPQISP